MTTPNIGNLIIHAACRLVGVTGGISNIVNIVSAIRNSDGDYTITIGSEIDVNQRHVIFTVLAPVSFFVQSNTAGETDSILQVLAFNNAGAAADPDFINILVLRTQLPG